MIRDANVVQLDVDSEVNHVVGPVNPDSTDTKKPVFVGGAPGKPETFDLFCLSPPTQTSNLSNHVFHLSEPFLPESIATKKAYVGCMRNLAINNKQVSFSKASLVSGAVSVGTCPAA